MSNIVKALLSLKPTSSWELQDPDDYSTLKWFGEGNPPTEAEVLAEKERLKQIEISTAYIQKRASEYPPITDYLDGVVKGDQEQIDAYIAACQAVKAKYPKGV